MKNRWTVTLPNSAVKRFQSQVAADDFADMYGGAVTAPDVDIDETGGEPISGLRESNRERQRRQVREAAEEAEREADGTGGEEGEAQGTAGSPNPGDIDLSA